MIIILLTCIYLAALPTVPNSAATMIFSDAPKIEAVIYAMATKFLDQTDLNEVKEGIKMTELGLLIYNDGIADEAADNAKNLFINGASFELVRKSIKHISDEALQKIYDEVMASNKQ